MKILKQKRIGSIFIVAVGITLISVIITASISFIMQKKNNVGRASPTSTQKITPTQPEPEKWHINNTQQWATYSNTDAPFTMQYPPQWEYSEQDTMSVAGKEEKTPAAGVRFKLQNDLQDAHIAFMWGTGFSGSPDICATRPTIQLQKETLTGCENKSDKGNNDDIGIEIHTSRSGQNVIIRAFTSKSVPKEQILKILSTLSFTK